MTILADASICAAVILVALVSLHIVGRAQYRGLKHGKENNRCRADLLRYEAEARWKDEVE